MERLTRKDSCGNWCVINERKEQISAPNREVQKVFDYLAELDDKFESGQMVELPKFGDTYWYIYSGGVPEAVTVTRIEVEINQSETRIYAYGRACGGLIGVIMFPTYEQAEARLKEIREAQDNG